MTTVDSDRSEGVASLRDWLDSISTRDSLEGLDARLHSAVRGPAKLLLERGASLTVASINEIEASAELAALSAAVHLRSSDLLVFWEPLLKPCLSGRSTAPLADLQRARAEAGAVAERVRERPKGPVRDEVLRLAEEAAERLEKWIPETPQVRSFASATRYSRGAFERTEDEEGNPIDRPEPVPEEAPSPPDSTLRQVLGWIATLAAVGALGFGVWTYVSQPEEQLPAAHYRVYVDAVSNKRIEGVELVLTMAGAWIEKPEAERISDLERLASAGGEVEQFETVRLENTEGKILARRESNGSISWGQQGLRADQLGNTDEFSAPRAPGDRPSSEEGGPSGLLERPLRADEIPIESTN